MIIYFNRNTDVGFSIQKVFGTITDEIAKTLTIKNLFLPHTIPTPINILKNGLFVFKNRNKTGINHVTGAEHYLAFFLPTKNTIVTVHDIMYLNYLTGIKRLLWKLLYIRSLKLATKITFISLEAKLKTLEHINLSEDKLSIIPNPVGNEFNYSHKEFNDAKPVILHIGTLERKNLSRTIEALKGIDCHLRIIGKLNEKDLNLLLKNEIEYSNGVALSDEEIVEEYKKCDIVNFVSLLEGFGMPIIEGQATGRVVITSNIPPMNGVASQSAVLVNPYNIDEINKAYVKVIKNTSYRNKMIKLGLVNVKNYSVEKIAKQYKELYSLVENSNK